MNKMECEFCGNEEYQAVAHFHKGKVLCSENCFKRYKELEKAEPDKRIAPKLYGLPVNA